MRICLINPPVSCFDGSAKGLSPSDFFGSLPLGLLYVASVLREHGHVVAVVDCVRGSGACIASFGNEHTYGIPLDELGERMSAESPDVIGITCQFTANANNLLRAARQVKAVCPSALVIAGGPHPTVADREILEVCPEIDVVVRGEGERTVLHLLDSIVARSPLDNVRGISFRCEGGDVRRTADADPVTNLDDIPLPAYDLVDMPAYLGRKGPNLQGRLGAHGEAVSMITSRGCPFQCVFCSVRLTMTRKWRGHSPEYFVEHVQFLRERYGVTRFRFEDDSILTDKRRFRAMLELLIERRVDIHWDTPNGVVANHLDDDTVRLMKQAGCVRTAIGVESGNQRVLDCIVRKKLRLDTVERVAQICRKYRLPCFAFFIIGFPGETKRDIEDTVQFALKLARDYDMEVSGAMIATPLLGTDLYEICKRDGLLAKPPTPESYFRATGKEGSGMIQTDEFTPEYLSAVSRQLTVSAYRHILFRALTSPKRFVELYRGVTSSKRGLLYLRRLCGLHQN